jgi:hypothetical protein
VSEWRRVNGLGRRDASEPEVAAAFREGGASVQPISGPDVPDLLVGYRGTTHLVEVKTGNAKLRPGQQAWHAAWCGEAPVVVRNAAQAKKWLRLWEAAVPELAAVLRAQEEARPTIAAALRADEDAP